MSFDRYFTSKAEAFSSLYRSERVARLIGRGALFDRLTFAVEKAVEVEAKRVLDVGCGSGPLFEPLAQRGIHVTGVDPAPSMVALARQAAERFPDLVEVRQQGWEDVEDEDTHDLAVALGVFDYVDDPGALLGVMARAAPWLAASFPNEGLRTEFRRLRYGRHGVNVYGYDRGRLAALAQAAGLEIRETKILGRAGLAVLFRRGG